MVKPKNKKSQADTLIDLLSGQRSVFSHMIDLDEVPATSLEGTMAYLVAQEVTGDENEIEHQRALSDSLLKAAKQDNYAQVVHDSYMLGALRGSLAVIAGQEAQQEVIRESAKAKRLLPLKAHQASDKILKKMVQGIALEIWGHDSEGDLRTSAMTDIVMTRLGAVASISRELIKNQFADTGASVSSTIDKQKSPSRETVRRWIAEIAPAHARISGAPRKK